MAYYLVPRLFTTLEGIPTFAPKYAQPDALGPGWNLAPWSAMDYGLENAFLLRTDTTAVEHTTLTAQVDVLALPADLDGLVGAAALVTLQTKLEALNLPGNWITAGHTYRQVLRAVRRVITFMQRWRGQFGSIRVFGGSVTLDTKLNQLTPTQRQRLTTVAMSLGLDTSAVAVTMTLREALRLMADQLPEITVGGDVL